MNQHMRRLTLAGLLYGISAAAQGQQPDPTTTPVPAQPPPAAATQQATPAADPADDVVELDEVVVTARKREEKLREVPIAASVITEATRETLVLDNMDDYLRQLPSTTLVTSGPEYLNDISMRGQGSGRLGFSETATGLFRDGMYNAGGGFGGRSLSRMDLFDIERIEVLRGPQGALFGRNSVGGAINVMANRPDTLFGASATVRAGTNERRDFEAVLNAPLSDTVGLRVGGLINDQNGGFIVNETTGNETDAQRYQGVRGVLDFTPSDALKLGVLYEYYDAESPAFSGLGQRPTRVGGSVLDPEPYRRSDMNREGVAKITEHSGLLTADYALPWANLAVKLNHRSRDGGRSNEDNDHFAGQSSIDVAPGDPIATPDYTVAQFEDYQRSGAQIYLASTGTQAWSWLVGIEGLWSESAMENDPDHCLDYTGAAQPATAGCFVGQTGLLPTQSAAVRSGGRLGLNHEVFTEDLDSYSLFGSVDWRLTEQLMLGLEMRVQTDRKDFTFTRYSEDPLVYFGTGAPPPGLLMPIVSDPDGAAGPEVATPVQFCPPTLDASLCAVGLEAARLSAQRDWTFWTPAATLHYQASEAQALYLRFATAYRPGGFNTNLPPTTVRDDLETILLYEPEKASSYEAGWKGSLFGGFLEGEAALFYTETRDVQVVSAPSPLSRGFILQNAGDAYVYGLELELRNITKLGAGRLITSLAVSSQKGKFKDGASALLDANGDGVPEPFDLSGNEVPRLRDYQATLNLAYSAPVSDKLNGFIGMSWQTADGGQENPDNTRPYEGYSLLDARIGVQGARWKFSLFGRNLTNQRYLLNLVSANYYWNDPRTFGAELTVTY